MVPYDHADASHVAATVEQGRAADDDEGNQAAGVLLQIGLAIVVLAVGFGVTYFLVSQKTAPARLPAARAAPVVQTILADVGTVAADVEGFGRLRASRDVSVVPQVGGRVVAIHPDLRPGGTLDAGAVLFEIDPTDYEIALEQREADVERAEASLERLDARRRSAMADVARRETALETMRAEAAVSRAEYVRINPDRDVPPLVAKVPQLRENEALLEAAEAALSEVDAQAAELEANLRLAEAAVRQAQVTLDRTRVTLPADGGPYRVASESVDVGQTVSPGVAVAQVFDAGSLEVAVPLDDADLRFVQIPGSTATVAAGDVEASGTVARTGGEVDPQTQLVEVIVVLDDPPEAFVPGRFVSVTIDGTPIEGVARLPRQTVTRTEDDRSRVNLADDGELRFADVTIIRRDAGDVLVRGLDDGARVIVTPLDVVTDGMPVQAETP